MGPVSELITTAVLRQQVALLLLARLGARLWLVLSPNGWADTPALWALAGLFAGYDVALAVAVHRQVAPPLWVRLLLDTGDVALWAMLCPADRHYTAAVVVALPIIAVITIDRGVPAGLGAGLVLTAGVVGARGLVGEMPYAADPLIYSVFAVVLGVIIARLLPAEARRQHNAADRLGQADLVAAELAGSNDVITGVGADAIDDLQSSIMRLTAAEVDAAAALRAAVARHKQALGERTRAEAVYLRDLLDKYSASVRAHEPAVARHVFFDIRGEDGVCVLSRQQANQLTQALAATRVAGIVEVRVARQLPRRPMVVQIGPHRFVLATSTPRVHLPMVPVATAALALFVLSLSHPYYAAVPLRLTVPLTALFLAYAVSGLMLVRRFGRRVDPWLQVGTLAPFTAVAVFTAHDATTYRSGILLLGPLAGLALLLGTVVQPPIAVLAACAGLSVVSAVVVATATVSARFVAAEMIWPVISFLGAFVVSRAVVRLSGELSTRLAEDRGVRAAAARRVAAGRELAYLLEVLTTGDELCAAAREGPVRTQVEGELRRLRDLVRTRAEALGT